MADLSDAENARALHSKSDARESLAMPLDNLESPGRIVSRLSRGAFADPFLPTVPPLPCSGPLVLRSSPPLQLSRGCRLYLSRLDPGVHVDRGVVPRIGVYVPVPRSYSLRANSDFQGLNVEVLPYRPRRWVSRFGSVSTRTDSACGSPRSKG